MPLHFLLAATPIVAFNDFLKEGKAKAGTYCTEKDLANWVANGQSDKYWWTPEHKKNYQMYRCAIERAGDADSSETIEKCLTETNDAVPYSEACIDKCINTSSHCIKTECSHSCSAVRDLSENWMKKCEGCVHDKCVPEFLKCSGFPGEEQALTGNVKCVDADKQIWETHGKKNYHKDMSKCGTACWGKGPCVQDCIMKEEHYSSSCSSCFGGVGACTRANCKAACFWGETQGCTNCVNHYCTPNFVKCSGFQVPTNVMVELIV